MMRKGFFERNFTEGWKNVFNRFLSEDGFALLYSTFYVVTLGGTRLLIDPCLRLPWMAQAIGERITADFDAADGILISHAHVDHFCPNAIRASEKSETPWYVPEIIPAPCREKMGLAPERVQKSIRDGETFRIGSITVTAFSMPHTDADGSHVMPEFGYLLEGNGKRLFFPMDIRNYDPAFLPKIGQPDMAFLHVWLGRAKALDLPCEPELTQFCTYAEQIGAKRVVLAHLQDMARTPEDRWTFTHCGLIADRLFETCPQTHVLVPQYGTWYNI